MGILLLNKKHIWKLSIVTTELPADTKNSHSWNIKNMAGSGRQKYWKTSDLDSFLKNLFPEIEYYKKKCPHNHTSDQTTGS